MMESSEDIAAALIANDDAAEAGEPRQGTLDLPTVAAKALAALDAAAGDARDDGPLAQGPAAARIIVALVGVQFGRSALRSADALPDRRDGVDGGFERLARCIEDPRAPERIRHTLAEMIRFRALLIAAGYPDANDCDTLRSDPAFKMAVGRLPESGADLCSQPTISR
ncbi:hypothetical protein J2847_006653, partial [Azospirillum agricola]|nr:hypothetical protein [Azospirillum agricola]